MKDNWKAAVRFEVVIISTWLFIEVSKDFQMLILLTSPNNPSCIGFACDEIVMLYLQDISGLGQGTLCLGFDRKHEFWTIKTHKFHELSHTCPWVAQICWPLNLTLVKMYVSTVSQGGSNSPLGVFIRWVINCRLTCAQFCFSVVINLMCL